MSGGEGRASRLHHPDDVNVVPTDCGWCRAGAPVLGRPAVLLLDCAGGVEWPSQQRVCFSAPFPDRRPDLGACDHRAVQGRSVSGGCWRCVPRSGSPSVRIGRTILWWDGPAPDVDPRMGALARGASSGRSKDRSYAFWRDASWRGAFWRELCGVKLSAREPFGHS